MIEWLNANWVIVASALIAVIVLCVISSPKLMLKIVGRIMRFGFLRVRIHGIDNIPYSGPVLLVSNHISLLDLIMIQSFSRRKVRFMVHTSLVSFIPIRWIFRYLGVMEVPSIRRPKAMVRFFEDSQRRLRKGEILCFFPEGAISGNGSLMRFRSGVQPLLPPELDIPVIPIRLGMVSGRMSGIHNGKLQLRAPLSLPVDYSIYVGEPINPRLSAFELRQKISRLGAMAEKQIQPGEKPLHTHFIFNAKRHPFKTTFADGMTGDMVNNFNTLIRVIIFSRLLRKLNKGDDTQYTGVLLPNMPISAVALLAVMSSDRTPAMINFSSGQEVALAAARRAGIKKILTSRKFLDKLKWEPFPEMVLLEDVAKTITKGDKIRALLMALLLPTRTIVRNLAPSSCYNMHNQAVLLFSSGSTGTPKAVMLTHHNLTCNTLSFVRVIDWNRSVDRIAGNLPMFHAYGFMVGFAFPSIFGTMSALIPNPLDAAALVKSVRDFKLTILTATPTFLQKYMTKATGEDFKTLRLVITGAEKLRPELAAKFHEMTGRDIIEGYGCTELSPIATINLSNSIYALGAKADHPGSIGCPLPGIHIRIVDPDTGVELAPGASGRMQVMAGSVMKGYLNDEDLTARVLQDGYYDTGDIAKMDLDGYVYITGRASRFSKIGGEMVPHEGVEEAITRIRARETREIAVAGRGDSRKGERLVVFYTADDFNIPEILDAMRKEGLPNIWIPKADDFVKIDELPLLGSGKLDLMRLRQMADAL